MFYKNARIFGGDFHFHTGAFEVKDGRFGVIFPSEVPQDAIDLEGATVIPGLVDLHIHGAMGADFSDGDYAGLEKMARYLAEKGITSFAPTSPALPYESLEKAFANAKKFQDAAPAGHARLMGIHMEGPYLSGKKKGAQNGAYLKNPDLPGFERLYSRWSGLISIVDVAPELSGAAEFVEKCSKLCTVSVAHTDGDYEAAKTAFSRGATHLTHLFNAMSGIHHRDPGVIPAAAENQRVRAEVICDGIHLHPAAVRLAFAMFGGHRMILVSDALACCGMPEGEYALAGQRVFLQGNSPRLADGTLAGAATDLFDCMRNAVLFGIDETDAIRAATFNPACALGVQDRVGSIATGKLADFILCRSDFSGRRVFMNGQEIT